MLNLKNTLDGYLKNIEVIGNTVQDTNNLADIRSVGDKVEGQELYNISIQVDNGEGVSEVVEILSPVQLEKVGDVADRIICKDGVWGVEKNVGNRLLNGDTYIEVYEYSYGGAKDTGTHYLCGAKTNDLNVKGETLFVTGNVLTTSNKISDASALSFANFSYFSAYLPKAEISSPTNNEFKKWYQENPTRFYYQFKTPQFIPLPHDQQVKLRTFAGQTNIVFNTEIAGQVKAQVPKSLGATVNTHTEQIKDLHNSLDRVKKLEETTVSTVETGSSFTTVDATSNGYFEDVKLEGKTLVNLIQGFTPSRFAHKNYNISCVAPNTMYTVIMDIDIIDRPYFGFLNNTSLDWDVPPKPITQSGLYVNTITTGSNTNIQFRVNGMTNEVNLKSLLLLEGDHTNNPPEYFEGLMSVGQDVKEVSVESVNENLLRPLRTGNNLHYLKNVTFENEYSINYYAEKWGSGFTVEVLGVVQGETYVVKCDSVSNGVIRGVAGSALATSSDVSIYDGRAEIVATSSGTGLIQFKNATEVGNISFTNLRVVKKGSYETFKPQILDKKPLLYYNPTTEMWEKPILREWDTIEKHSDGKYYYHKRSGEVVLNGSDSYWWSIGGEGDTINGLTVYTPFTKAINDSSCVSDKLKNLTANTHIGNTDFVLIGTDTLVLNVSKSKLTKQDVEGFKAWLKDNPTTVVYQLKQEEVYECTNIDLMTYNGETNYIINSGAISPKSLLKVHNNISNVVKILQEKVSLLENTFIAGLKSVLSGDMYSLATILYPEDFEQNDNTEQDIMVIPE